MAEIIPSVGRKVWFHPSQSDLAGSKTPPMSLLNDGPLDATIVAVHNHTSINVIIFDADGVRHFRESVRLLKQNDKIPADEGVARWMPYQHTASVPVGVIKV